MSGVTCTNPYIATSAASVCGSYILITLLDDYIRNHTDISGLCDRIVPVTVPDEEYDFIVVGGGSGGAVAAGRLAEAQKWKVLLVEAGGDEPLSTQVPLLLSVSPDIDWGYKTEPEKDSCLGNPEKKCPLIKAKALGGCSVLNGMVYMRGVPQDFENWVNAGNTDWTYDKVFPFFQSLEGNTEVGTVADAGYHGTDGPWTVSRFPDQPAIADDIIAATQELGYGTSIDLNGKTMQGFAITQTNNRNGTRLSASKAFLWPQKNNPYLHIMLHTTATKVVFDPNFRPEQPDSNFKRIQGVQISYNSKSFLVKAKKEVILSAGTINTPQVLLLSGIGSKTELQELNIQTNLDLPGVGKNFHNHVAFLMNFALTKVNITNELNGDTMNQYFTNHTGSLSSTGLNQLTGRVSTKYARADGTWPDLQFYFDGFNANCNNDTIRPKSGSSTKSYKRIRIIPAVLHPKSFGQIRLKSNIPMDPPLIEPNNLAHPDDVATLIEGIRIAQNISKSNVLTQKYGISFVKGDYGYCDTDFEYDTYEFWACAVKYSTHQDNHQVGTCKMGVDRMAVVNQQLIVHGTENLRILDGSIMPYIISGNSAAPIMMMAERGVSFIKKKYSSSSELNDEPSGCAPGASIFKGPLGNPILQFSLMTTLHILMTR